jgi:hypothetical protein
MKAVKKGSRGLSRQYLDRVAALDQDSAQRLRMARRGTEGSLPAHIEMQEDVPPVIKAHRKMHGLP